MEIRFKEACYFLVTCIHCPAAQRSAQELPLVEKQSLDSYPASGGKRMLISGHNFLPESKVMFVEKAQGESKLVFSHSFFINFPPFASSLALVFFYYHSLSLPLSFCSLGLSFRQNRAWPARRPMWCALGRYIFKPKRIYICTSFHCLFSDVRPQVEE